MKKKRIMIPVCVLAGVLVVCLGGYGLMQYFGSPLIPGSLERRYAREVDAHLEELLSFSQECLKGGTLPEDRSLPSFIREAQVVGQNGLDQKDLFVEFTCDGWGLTPSSSYYGFYYSPNGPRAFQGVETELIAQDGGFAWQAEGDNHGFTREIGEGFYYFEAHF
jgi:hypothetical protein